MKKIFAMVVLLAFIAACAPEPASYEREDSAVKAPEAGLEPVKPAEPLPPAKAETGRKPPAYTPPSEKIDYKEPASAVDEKEVAAAKKLDPAIKDLLDRAKTKVNSYRFLYKGPDSNNVAKDTYYYLFKDGKVDKVKIKKYGEDYYVRENESTHIYINPSAKTVSGCCEVLSRCISSNIDNTKKVFEFGYAEFAGNMPKPPHEWLLQIPEGAVVRGTETREGMTVTSVAYTKNGHEFEMKINSMYGLPQLIIDRVGDDIIAEYHFNDFSINGEKAADFVAPCIALAEVQE